MGSLTMAEAAEIIYAHAVVVDCTGCDTGVVGMGTPEETREGLGEQGWVFPDGFNIEYRQYGLRAVVGLCPACSTLDAEVHP